MLDRIIFAGSGGQGIQFAGQILAQAALQQMWEASYIPSYGAERRGGISHCFVIVADHVIHAPLFREMDVLLAFDQRARAQYAAQVSEKGIILVNADLANQPVANEKAKVVSIPALQTAEKIREDAGCLNLVMVGAYLALARGMKLESVMEVLKLKSAKKPELLAANQAALKAGAELIQVMKK